MTRNRVTHYNKKGNPIIPRGYQRVGIGRAVKRGDRFHSINAKKWLPTSLLEGQIIERGCYIRKIKIPKTLRQKTKEKRIKFVAKELPKKIELTDFSKEDIKKIAIAAIDVVNQSNREVTHKK